MKSIARQHRVATFVARNITQTVEGSILSCFLLLRYEPLCAILPSATYARASPLRCDDVLTPSFFLPPPPPPPSYHSTAATLSS